MARFLFAEDHETVASVCVRLLWGLGHTVDIAKNGQEALACLNRAEYDALVTAGGMPGMDGFQLLASLEDEVRARLPLALKTGALLDNVDALIDHGVDWLVSKPFTPAELVDACLEMLDARAEKLLSLCPMLDAPERRAGQGIVDLPLLEHRARDAAAAFGGSWEQAGVPRTIFAPSPLEAVRMLAASVRDWRGLVRIGSADARRRVGELGGGDATYPGRVASEVHLGDREIREQVRDLAEPERTRIHLALCAAYGGWRWRLGDGLELVVARPAELHEPQGVAHDESGPALLYRDGFEVFALYGVWVPRHVILDPSRISIDEIRNETHAEVRRVKRELFGEDRYLVESDSTLVDADTVPVDFLAPRGRTITRMLIDNEDSRRFLVASDGSTRRVYYMEVPTTCTTCQMAYDALSGRPGVRTLIQT